MKLTFKRDIKDKRSKMLLSLDKEISNLKDKRDIVRSLSAKGIEEYGIRKCIENEALKRKIELIKLVLTSGTPCRGEQSEQTTANTKSAILGR